MARTLHDNSNAGTLGLRLGSPPTELSQPWRRSVRVSGQAMAASIAWGPNSADFVVKVEERETARRSRLEAVLLVAREPLSTRKLARLANLSDGTEARALIGEIRRLYQKRGAAFQVEELAGGFQLLTRPQLAPWLRRLNGSPEEVRLSTPALETLAVVAYRQPVVRADVEAIRGVGCGEILRQLMERDLLRIVGRSDELGRPFLYGTTKRFLRVFGMKTLEDLPRVARFADPSDVEPGPSLEDR